MSLTRNRLCSALALCVLVSPAMAGDSVEERIARIELGLLPRNVIQGQPLPTASLVARMAALKVPGVSIAVINNGTIEWARGYGVAEAGSARAVTPQTLFQAASISKPLAAMTALNLVEHGKLSLDEDVNARLTTWKVPTGAQTADNPVTLRALLNHSAGTTVSGFRGYAQGAAVPTLIEVLDGAKPANSAAVRVDRRPGEAFRYSGGGLSIVQLLMTTASGKPFASLMKDVMLDPLGMNNSTYEQPLPPALHGAAANAHDANGVPFIGKWHTYPEQAAAGLWTTPSDLARFAIELQNASMGKSNKIVSQAMATQMLTRLKGTWGLGIGVGTSDGLPTFNHGGANAGFRVMMFAFTTTGKGAVIMTNADRGDVLTAEVMRSIAAEYGWSDYRFTVKTLAKVDPKLYARYVGNYALDGVAISVVQEDDRLYAKAPMLRPDPVELLPASETSYFNLADTVEFAFEQDAAGTYDLVIKAGQPRRAKRVP